MKLLGFLSDSLATFDQSEGFLARSVSRGIHYGLKQMKPDGNYWPHQGPKECARRMKQYPKGLN